MILLKIKKIVYIGVSWVCLLGVVGCSSLNLSQTDVNFKDTSRFSYSSDIFPCCDYASRTTYTGEPYIVDVKVFRLITRHEGIDFCTSTGAEVISPANGTIVEVVRHNQIEGGWVTIQSKIKHKIAIGEEFVTTNLYLQLLHITPLKDIKVGQDVQAGQLIGFTEPGGKPAAGPRPHVHLEARTNIMSNGITHVNPNLFWQKGPGIVTCFDPKNPPTDSQLVAPVKCKSK